jgi:ubiquinone/menaquinone biosynthesis C-methylase UbiE
MSNYNEWHRLHAKDDDLNNPWHQYAINQIRNINTEGKSILEIGCGRGGFSRFMKQEYPTFGSFYACDYSETALEVGKESEPDSSKIIWQKEDIQNLSFDSSSFDIVISCETIEHVPFPYKALEELNRVLKPGGIFILTCPSYFNFFGIWCLYRKFIGKPFTEGGQPYVNYILFPSIYFKIKSMGFIVKDVFSSELIVPARIPKTYYKLRIPKLLTFLGSRTFYTLVKPS